MTSYEKMKELLKLQPPAEVDEACRYLEANEMEFCVDFGTENAIQIAWKVFYGSKPYSELTQ